jgi:prevent-host-death family protein
MEVNIHHAKTNLSRLILRVEAGEEVLIARNGKPVARLVPVETAPRKLYKPGVLKGRLIVPPDFLDPNTNANRQIEELFTLSLIQPTASTKARKRRSKSSRP